MAVSDGSNKRNAMAERMKSKQLDDEKKIEEKVAQQSLKLAQQEKDALDKLMNDVKDLVKE